MKTQFINSITIAGISIRTSNDPGKAMVDIPQLWNTFFAENIPEKVQDKEDDLIYCVYYDYEGDYTKPYKVLLGYKVTTPVVLEETLVAKTFEEGMFKKYTAKGKLTEGIVYDQWLKIWKDDIKRAYKADYEIHSGKFDATSEVAVDIFIGVK